MDLVIVGMGRAGGALAWAARSAGHDLVGVLSRSQPSVDAPLLAWDEPVPDCDLAIIAVSDAAIREVAARLAPRWNAATPAVHLSGFTSVAALEPVAATGAEVGSFHPLQTLPDPRHGAEALAGAHVAITAGPPLSGILEEFAVTLEMRPFSLADDAKPLYHAAAAAAANYVVEALAVAHDLLAAAGVDAAVAEPLTLRVVENALSLGPEAALTGPIARGDLDTVRGQQAAADGVSETVGRQFRLLAQATAERVGVRL